MGQIFRSGGYTTSLSLVCYCNISQAEIVGFFKEGLAWIKVPPSDSVTMGKWPLCIYCPFNVLVCCADTNL